MSIIDDDQKFIWHPFTQAKTAGAPIEITHAKGSYLFTGEGKKLFDGISSWWTNVHGHSHQAIAKAIYDQALNLEHVIFASFTHAPALNLAKEILPLVPKNLSRLFFSDNGSTAVETALKMAYQFWQNHGEQRKKFVALENSYHGDTFGAMAVSERSVFNIAFWPLLFEVETAKSTCVSRAQRGVTNSDLISESLSSLETILRNNQGDVAAIIIEPRLQAAGGMLVWPEGLCAGIFDLAKKYNTLLIADEVMTGFYRTGKMFACEHENVQPDILCLAKGLTGGFLPLSLTLASEEIYQAFVHDEKSKALLHGHTFTANPIGCAASIASLKEFAKKDVKENISKLCDNFQKYKNNFHELKGVKSCRPCGAVFIIELESKVSGYTSTAGNEIAKYCFDRGLYIRPLGNIIYFMPPYSITPDESIYYLQLIKEAILKTMAK